MRRLVDKDNLLVAFNNALCSAYGKIDYAFIEGVVEGEKTFTPATLQPLTYNENDYLDCDEFVCHKCGIHIEDWKQIRIDPDTGEKNIYEYTFKCCPECGAKIISHKSCEFCRWHLRDGTCFNKLEKRSTTKPEDSCWIWEERE